MGLLLSAEKLPTAGPNVGIDAAACNIYNGNAQDVIVRSRMLVNCGDGVQRFCNENHIKLFSLSCILITSLAPHNISGFPGVFLALSSLVIIAI